MPDNTLPDPQQAVDAVLNPTPAAEPPKPVDSSAAPTPLPPLPPTPEPTPASPPPPAPTVPTELLGETPAPPASAIPTPSAATAVKEDTPLAFVGGAPTSPAAPMASPATLPPTPAASVMPPTPPPPPTETPAYMNPAANIPTSPPKKKKGGKILAIVLGLFLLAGSVIFGAYYYLSGVKPRIAEVNGGCGPGYYVCNKSSGCCHVFTGADKGSSQDTTGGNTTSGDGTTNSSVCTNPLKPKLCSCAAGSGCVASSVSCSAYCGTNGSPIPSDNSGPALCTDINSPDSCRAKGGSPTQQNGAGDYCNDQGQWCDRYRLECNIGGQHCIYGQDEVCKKVEGKCGYNPSPSPSTSPSPSPNLACSSLTKDKEDSAIVVGTKVTFTCAGAITHSSAVISYKFRYSVDNGTWTALTNKTATTAELTVTKAGEYKAQCHACATIASVKICDPTWGTADTTQ